MTRGDTTMKPVRKVFDGEYVDKYNIVAMILGVAKEWTNIHGTAVAVTAYNDDPVVVRYQISIRIGGTTAQSAYRIRRAFIDSMESSAEAKAYVRGAMGSALVDVFERWKIEDERPVRRVPRYEPDKVDVPGLINVRDDAPRDSLGRVLCDRHNFPMYEHHGKYGCPICTNERRGWGFSKQHGRDGKIEVSNG